MCLENFAGADHQRRRAELFINRQSLTIAAVSR
jgi:hypothetical protein